MPYASAIYGVSHYGQLSLPNFDIVGGLLRYSEPEPNYGVVRVDYPDPLFFVERTDHAPPMTVHRYGAHEVRMVVTRGPAPETTVSLSRSNNTLQLHLDRSFETSFNKIMIVRNWTDLAKT